ncbi:hypothetical protein [Mycoplasma struthionis]|uniref:Uncharacterized protein n=1 Tax=Mycoplasma struthionis TaxID=538220 RepID=A0A3G8LHJ4_9MOLU|nr:hypothetical protein [Mycoplasma struthionis]AZG68824.1 hypothetical protein EGN60_02580 [Mycoplasma struthionis]
MSADLKRDIPKDVNSLNSDQLRDYRNKLATKKSDYPALVESIKNEKRNYDNAKENAENVYGVLARDNQSDFSRINNESITKGRESYQNYLKTNRISDLQNLVSNYNKAASIYNSIIEEQRDSIRATLNKIDMHNKEIASFINSGKDKNKATLDSDAIKQLQALKVEFDKQNKENSVSRELTQDKLTTKQLRDKAKEISDFEKTYTSKLNDIFEKNKLRNNKIKDYEKAKTELFGLMFKNANNLQSGPTDKKAYDALSGGKDSLNASSQPSLISQTLNTLKSIIAEYKTITDKSREEINLRYQDWLDRDAPFFENRVNYAISEAKQWANNKSNNVLVNYKTNLQDLNRVTDLAIVKYREMLKQKSNLMAMIIAREMQNVIETFYTDWQAFGRDNFRANGSWHSTKRQRLIDYVNIFYNHSSWGPEKNVAYYTKKFSPNENDRFIKSDNFWASDEGEAYKNQFDHQDDQPLFNVMDRLWNLDGYVTITKTLLNDLIKLWDKVKNFKPQDNNKNKYSSYAFMGTGLKTGLNNFFRWYLQTPELIDGPRRMFTPKGLVRFHDDVTSKL